MILVLDSAGRSEWLRDGLIFTKSGRPFKVHLETDAGYGEPNLEKRFDYNSLECKIIDGTTELITYEETANYRIEDSNKVFSLRINFTRKYQTALISF